MSGTGQDSEKKIDLSGLARLSTDDFRVVAALVRTAFSSEQTLMSWMRTALSLFTFGFTITQFFYYLEETRPDVDLSAGPRRLGIALVTAGLAVLLLALVEHVRRIQRLQKLGLPDDTEIGLPIGSTVALLLTGVVALVTILLNWHL
jgi:putative membrane protein